MKKYLFFATIVAVSMAIAMPAQAQSRKDKKAAQKEEWQREQRQKAEEDELRHKMRMDSIANANRIADERAAAAAKARKEAAEKADAERRAAEAEAKAEAKRKEAAAALEEKDFDEPCMDYESTAEMIRARGIGEDFEQQMSADVARATALEELASQISTHIQSLVSNYKKQERKNLSRESLRRVEGMTQTEVDETSGFRIACRKTKTFVQNGERIFKTYMVVEVSTDMLLKPIYNAIQSDDELKIESDYEKFKSEFNEHFANNPQE